MTQSKTTTYNENNPTLLLVDDEVALLEVYSDVCQDFFNIETATGGIKAVEILKNKQIDVVLSDFNMKEGNGLLVLKEAHSRNIPIIMISASNEKSSLLKIANQKPFYFFDKMVNSNEILEKLKEAINYSSQNVENKFYFHLGKNAAKTIHDISNPLNVIVGKAEIIKIHKNNPKMIEQCVNDIETSVDRIGNMIQKTKVDFVEFKEKMMNKGLSETEAFEKNEEYLTEYSLLKFLFDFKISQEELLIKNKVKMHITLQNKQDKLVLMHQEDLYRVFSNLIENSIYEFKKHNQDLRLITFAVTEDNDKVYISVKDNGPGIPKDVKGKLFNSSFSTKPKGQGSGLGLSSCKEIIEKHNGSITVGEEFQGAEFILSFPILKTEVSQKAA